MNRFAALFTALDQTTSTNARVAALADYFREAPEDDRLWTVALLSGRRPRRAVTATNLREWAAERAGIPLWLFEEAYPVVGDLAETIALVLPEPGQTSDESLTFWIDETRALREADDETRKAAILSAWDRLDRTGRFLFNKLITGGFRMGVSQKLMTRALAAATGIEETALAHRIMGDWSPDTTTFERLILSGDNEAATSRPYPFCLAHPLEAEPDSLGDVSDWLAEWKWDGIRGQLVRRDGEVFVWSRGEELVTDRFPEFAATLDFVPDGTVIDGEIMAWRDRAALPFQALQTRIGRKTVSKRLLAETPVVMTAYDMLEQDGQDLRQMPFAERRARLEGLVASLPGDAPLRLSPTVPATAWADLAAARDTARERGAEGLMLKKLDSPYHVGRKRGDWWKWKVDPLTVDAVMIYAQAGHGRRANLFTDFTFAVPDEHGNLVPFTKAYSGLTDAEFREITRWVRANTLERFGPVRSVPPVQVFEIAFEGIQASSRHKSGIALRFPRMARWRTDKPVSEINTLADLKGLLASLGG
ncbi:ATP-dependent DNA ligase [Zhengella sp. ZM62]|uniref:ATP-dependent DNA ligase n=1 Tax=Zhengella sedimenti TaxID=3390035 RepID=UPI003975FB11